MDVSTVVCYSNSWSRGGYPRWETACRVVVKLPVDRKLRALDGYADLVVLQIAYAHDKVQSCAASNPVFSSELHLKPGTGLVAERAEFVRFFFFQAEDGIRDA